jgi:hypothetical protein
VTQQVCNVSPGPALVVLRPSNDAMAGRSTGAQTVARGRSTRSTRTRCAAERTRARGRRIKHETGAPVFRPEREADVLRKVAAISAGPLAEPGLSSIFREVMSACRALERPLTVAYLGPAGTFSELAMQRQFGTSVKGMPCTTLDEVFRATEAGSADFGIVPLENSSEGAVSRMDLLATT